MRRALILACLLLPGCAANRLMCGMDRQSAAVVSWYEIRGFRLGVASQIDAQDAPSACAPIVTIKSSSRQPVGGL